MAGGLTIGQVAAFAGVTIKTVRHYHRRGLLDEPRRDSSGYRRYTSADLLRLVQVRTLAEAGVPLAGIGDLLNADPELGFRPDFVATQREGLVLAQALAPQFLDGFVTQLERRLDDPEYVELQKQGWDALSWDPDDPRPTTSHPLSPTTC